MNTASRFNLVAALTVATAILAYCVAEPDLGLAAFSMPVLILSWWSGRSGAPWRMPRLAANLLVLGAVLRAGFNLLKAGSPVVVSDLTEFLVLIQLVKLFDRASPRDDAQLLTLSVFIVIGALLTSNSFLTGVFLLLYTPLATAAGMLLQIRVGLGKLDRAGGDRRKAELASSAGSLGRGQMRQFGRVVAAAVLSSFLLAMLAFMVTPRSIGQDQFGSWGRPRGGSSSVGFSDQIRLNEQGYLNPNDSTPVMDVLVRESFMSCTNCNYDLRSLELQSGKCPRCGRAFDRADRGSIGHQLGSIYLRGTARAIYDPVNFSWRQEHTETSSPEDAQEYTANQIVPLPVGTGRPNRVQYEQIITIRTPSRGDQYFFATWTPVAFKPDEDQRLLVSTGDLTLRRIGGVQGRLQYTVWSEPAGELTEYTERRVPLGFQTGRVRDLAEQLLTNADIPIVPDDRSQMQTRSAVSLIQNYLRSNYEYTLQMEAPAAGEDPIEMFLFRTRRGHCQFFASAMTAMCQSVGIDARVVLGYLGAEFSIATGQYLVRQSNAHAWVEAQTAPGRWYTIDPSPQADIDRLHKPSGGLLGRLKRLYDTMEFAWNHGVISFDETRRISLFKNTLSEGRLRDALQRARELFALARERLAQITGIEAIATRWGGLVSTVSALFLVVVLLRKFIWPHLGR
ncbi:MAG: DUF3488 domain-containing protein, partial [Phycisphaerales bacterium]|nr:DUF3488 domain-containing protein [Phycisphaerales bacterium]